MIRPIVARRRPPRRPVATGWDPMAHKERARLLVAGRGGSLSTASILLFASEGPGESSSRCRYGRAPLGNAVVPDVAAPLTYIMAGKQLRVGQHAGHVFTFGQDGPSRTSQRSGGLLAFLSGRIRWGQHNETHEDHTMTNEHPWGPAVLLSTALAVVLAGQGARAQLSYSSGQNVSPAYEGWEKDAGGNQYFVFGYMNRNREENVDIPVGAENTFEPGGPDVGSRPASILAGIASSTGSRFRMTLAKRRWSGPSRPEVRSKKPTPR